MILDNNALSAWAEGFAAVQAPLRSARRLVVPSIVLGEYCFGNRAGVGGTKIGWTAMCQQPTSPP